MVPVHGEHMDRAAALRRIDDSIALVDHADAFVAELGDEHAETTLAYLAQAMGTRIGPYGGVDLQTISIAKARSGPARPIRLAFSGVAPVTPEEAR
jgi:hypothetical protein